MNLHTARKPFVVKVARLILNVSITSSCEVVQLLSTAAVRWRFWLWLCRMGERFGVQTFAVVVDARQTQG